MKTSLVLYNISIQLYLLAIKLVSPWNGKAKAWLQGRKQVFSELENAVQPSDRIIWIHCASAGEFEQGKPIIEGLRTGYPQHRILVSFFSPSGYQAARNYPHADIICYLPVDTKKNAQLFLEITHPELILFIKYEYWYHFLSQAAFRHIPMLLCSAVFRADQAFFKWYGSFFRQILLFFRQIFVQDERSATLLKRAGLHACQVGGDTRFDRVAAIAANSAELAHIEAFIDARPAIVAGSTWPDDERLLESCSGLDIKLIIAPHEVNQAHLEELDRRFQRSQRYSAGPAPNEASVLIVDNVGMLSRLYRYATVAFVGGGFTKDGIHNILEAAVYGRPVVIGPNYQKYREARELIRQGGCFAVATALELKATLNLLLTNEEVYRQACKASAEYVLKNTGATEKVLRYIHENRLLTR